MNREISAIESILFAYAEPVSVDELADALDRDKKFIKDSLKAYEDMLNEDSRGLRLVQLNDSYTLSTKPENSEYVKNFIKTRDQKSLSKPALETLCIIAYNQPVTKIDIEELRGVKSDGVLRSLTEIGLIRISGKLDKIGKPNLYSTTDEFLKKFGLKNLNELPKLGEK